MRVEAIILAVLGAVACGTPQIGDGDGDSTGGGGGSGEGGAGAADAAPPDPVDDLPEPDAGVEDDDDCYRGSLGRLELIDATGFTSGSGVDAYFGLTAAIDGVPVGVFYLDLYGGIGSLRDGPRPGVYPITGDDTVWSLCAVCVWATFGVAEETWVMAQSGSVRLDEVGARLSGALASIELVEIDEFDEPVPGGCTATVTARSFDVAVE